MRYRALGLAMTAALLAGWTMTAGSADFPHGAKVAAIDVHGHEPGLNDEPVGTYVIPGTPLMLVPARTMKKSEKAFGVFGVFHAIGAGKDAAKASIAGEEAGFVIDYNDVMNRAFDQAAVAQLLPARGAGAAGTQLEIWPRIYLISTETGDAHLRLALRVKLHNGPDWQDNYNFEAGADHPLRGAQSWSDDHGKLLTTELESAYKDLIGLLAKDMQGYAWQADRVRVDMQVFGTPLGTGTSGAMLMAELDNAVVFRPDIKGLIAGINMISKDRINIMRN